MPLIMITNGLRALPQTTRESRRTVMTPSKSAAKVSSKQSHATASSLGADETKVKRLELKLDSRTLKADPTSDHLFFSRLTAAPDPPSICPDLAPPRSEQPLATVKLTRDSKYVAERWNGTRKAKGKGEGELKE
ncbi:unnamed protein product [Brassica rapa]|uniref:Uncharacterized protein n=1 Tax=Brassica campestris TaxID=3711 RepID=A0A8D9I5D8_BRACM|nr:unnamed protein product [Brassica rapa]